MRSEFRAKNPGAGVGGDQHHRTAFIGGASGLTPGMTVAELVHGSGEGGTLWSRHAETGRLGLHSSMRPYERLADNEFEDLIGDLLGAEEDCLYERFRRGPDLGIDLRCVEGNELDVVQCKHFLKSGMSKLRSEARKEAKKLIALDPQPTRYRFVSSRELTPGNKGELAEILASWVSGPEGILGGGDVEALLDRHPEVERRHVKMWLAGGTSLSALLNADVVNRSRALLATIEEVLPLYVQTDTFHDAHKKLADEHVCLISGRPGIGKTTLAEMLVADAIEQGYEPVAISYDIEEGWRLYDPSTPQVFYYDDFLGTTTLEEVNKNEDQRLVQFMTEIARSATSLFVLTTREYILTQARQLYESFQRAGIDGYKFVLRIGDYGAMDRAKILYNHVFQSPELPPEARTALVRDRRYERVVRHKYFNPRLIETIVNGFGPEEVAASVDFVDYAVAILEDPELLWRRVYDNQLSDRERALLHALVSMPLPAELDDLGRAFASLAGSVGVASDPVAYRGALQVLDDSLVATERRAGKTVVAFVNPGVEDFVRGLIAQSPAKVEEIMSSSLFFDQMRRLRTFLPLNEAEDMVRLSLAERAIELIESDSAVWILGGPIEVGTLERAEIGTEQRVYFLLELIGGRDQGPFAHLWSLVIDRIEEVVASWHRGVGSVSGAIDLAQLIDDEDSPVDPPDDLVEALKDLLKASAATPREYDQILALHEGAPEVFEDGEMAVIGDAFLVQAEDVLRYNAHLFKSIDEVEEYAIVAEALDVELDETILESAKDEVAHYIQDRENMDYDRWEDGGGRSAKGHGSEREQMEMLFNRLRDQ